MSLVADGDGAFAPLIRRVGGNGNRHRSATATNQIGRRGVDSAIIIGNCRADPVAR